MKLAILGSSTLALEAAVRFHLHGGAITWFNAPELNLERHFSSASNWEETTTPQGWSLIQKTDLPFTWENWTNHYYAPLVNVLQVEHSVKSYAVSCITKRFLAPQEVISGRSRFLDLFRVIFEVNPENFIEAQKESDPEVYKRLTEEMVHSLQNTVEMYEDFDLILDLRRATEPLSLSPSGHAIGEKRNHAHVISGLSALEKSKDMGEARDVIILGSGDLALEILLNLETWIEDPRNMLFIATTEEEPFSEVLKKVRPEINQRFLELQKKVEEELEASLNVFHQKLRDWQALDDFVRVKYPRPAEPIPRVNYFSGHNATAVDLLIDRHKLFVTLEKPEFREGKKHPENNLIDLKTLGVDLILSANGFKKKEIALVDHNEVGLFELTPMRPSFKDGWHRDLEKLKGIEDEIFKLFSPADSH